MDFLHKPVQCFHFTTRCIGSFHPFSELQQRLSHSFPQFIDQCQPALLNFAPRRAIALRIFRPSGISQPHLTMDLPLENVIFQNITFLCCQSGQAGFKPAEHVFVLISAADSRQYTHQQRQHRLFQNITALTDVCRNPVAFKNGIDHIGIGRHIPGSNDNIPTTAIPFRQQSADLCGCLFYLCKNMFRFQNPDSTTVSLKRLLFTKEMFLQMTQRRAIFQRQIFDLDRASNRSRNAFQLCHRASGRLKNFFLTIPITQQSNRHRPGLPRQYL